MMYGHITTVSLRSSPSRQFLRSLVYINNMIGNTNDCNDFFFWICCCFIVYIKNIYIVYLAIMPLFNLPPFLIALKFLSPNFPKSILLYVNFSLDILSSIFITKIQLGQINHDSRFYSFIKMHSRNTDFILEIQIENYNIHKLISKKSKKIKSNSLLSWIQTLRMYI